ncbi:MAG: zf-HC2 domain-containing protein [Acidobacteria bacterium]|nr:zf-HC2 domain-containing protein [Acidobacteriota bacterium]
MREHPDELVTAAYLDGTLEAGARDGVEAHLAECGECRSGVVLLRGAASSAPQAVPAEWIRSARAPRGAAGTSTEPPAESFTSRLVSALAAGVVIAVAMGMWFTTTTVPSTSRITGYRGASGGAFEGMRPAAGSTERAASLAFHWPAVAGADRYVINVESAAGEALGTIEARAGATSAAWPAGTATPPAGTLIWRIRAMALDRVIAESRPTAFEIR